jgi:Fe2+ or Zn2+ uptake regulation protein
MEVTLRNSKQRDLVLNIINNSYNHPTAEEIYIECRKQIPNISLGTVYRNLNLLIELNQIKKIKCDTVDHFDKNIPHHHFICTNCKKIIDIYNIDIPLYKEINGNIITEQTLTLKGICSGCSK